MHSIPSRCVKRPIPRWILWARPLIRMPFADPDDPQLSGWRYVLDLAFLGYRADRVRPDVIVITGRPETWAGMAT